MTPLFPFILELIADWQLISYHKQLDEYTTMIDIDYQP